ncbi:MAG: hypothetical protein J3Q66DRAFT_28492 [Benniella sp.]|nr:MAG: hypothetical protein J3Q66DRAFT_28492 [Benniella sp.]
MAASASSNTMIIDERLTLGIRCARPEHTAIEALDIGSKRSSGAPKPEGNSKTTLLTSRFRCEITRSWLLGKLTIMLKQEAPLPEHTMPKFKFVHCIPHNAANKAEAKVFEVSECDGTKNSHFMKPFMEGGVCNIVIEERAFFHKNNPKVYAFDLVLSTSCWLPSSLAVDTGPFLAENTTNRFKEIFPNKY